MLIQYEEQAAQSSHHQHHATRVELRHKRGGCSDSVAVMGIVQLHRAREKKDDEKLTLRHFEFFFCK